MFWELAKDGKALWQTVGEEFLRFFEKNKDGEAICKTVGDALSTLLSRPLDLPIILRK
jgi:hypothetical protein